MLTYDFSGDKGPLYEKLYKLIKSDIKNGVLKPYEKLPSKRALASNLGVSTITVENAYNQLIDEGYVRSEAKKGYFVESGQFLQTKSEAKDMSVIIPQKEKPQYSFDFSSNANDASSFPFSTWAKLMREVISLREQELLSVSPCGGVEALKRAIAEHLGSFRGMAVNSEQIIIGAGTEYLYELIIKLLGTQKVYSVENPGYNKIKQIYDTNGVTCRLTDLDEFGIDISKLEASDAEVAHISPTHHYPTGITMPKKRREELLLWAKREGRYIIEDDYDSEFRTNGRPIPPLFTMDNEEKVIYINTFSKSLTSTIRIGYMVLPEHLAREFYRKLSFYSCTVSTFEQYTLAEFIGRGYFEKHINRCRLSYGRKRSEIIRIIKQVFDERLCKIRENDSGLHFLLEFNTTIPDKELEGRIKARGIRLEAVTSFEMKEEVMDRHCFIFNYSNMQIDGLKEALLVVRDELQKG